MESAVLTLRLNADTKNKLDQIVARRAHSLAVRRLGNY